MDIRVWGRGAQWRLEGSWPDLAAANLFLEHLRVRSFASATVRAYAYDVLCFARFCGERELRLAEVVPADLFDWVAWQAEGRRPAVGNVVRLTRYAGAAPSSINRRVAAVRALFEHQVVLGARAENPVPAPRRGQGLRAKSRGVLGHLGPGRPRGGGRLVRAPQRLPEALEPGEVAAFLADLSTHRDRAITLAMLLGGLRAGEVRALKLTDVDQGLRRLRVCGKGGRERVVPVERAFFVELAAYLRVERPPGLATPECFVVLEGSTAGAALTEAGLRSVFRHHRRTSGAMRVRPHRLRCHTYSTMLVNAGMSLQALMALLGHVTPEMTLRYATLASPALRAAYDEAIGKARPRLPLIVGGRPAVPAKVEWLRSEFLKTRVAHGYCTRHLAQEACPYANICEQCDNFVPTPEFAPALVDQLADVQALQTDAEQRRWASEVERHGRVIQRLQEHLGRLDINPNP